MNWYVKWETGTIAGPMTREDAQAKADRTDGLGYF